MITGYLGPTIKTVNYSFHIMTTQKAIERIVDFWCKQGKSFSIYEVIEELRDKCNAGVVSVNDRPIVLIQGRQTHWFDCDDETKQMVIDAVEGQFGYKETFNGVYRVFSKDTSSSSFNLPIVDDKDDEDFIGFRSVSDKSSRSNPSVPSAKDSWEEDIEDYLNRNLSKGVTLKNIQSALKRGSNYGAGVRESVSSELIKKTVKDLGYKVANGPIATAKVFKTSATSFANNLLGR